MTVSPRKITFASPSEPSGASWLLNCFIELGIRVDHRPAEMNLWRNNAANASIWVNQGDHVTLNPRAEIMGKWMPSLIMRDRFTFRDDVVIDYRQDLPLHSDDLGTVLVFLRDPRDALYSMYRRRGPDLTFQEFCNWPNPTTLLRAVEHWLLHAQSWVVLSKGKTYLFEAYKQDATALLGQILSDLHLSYSDEQISQAIAASGLEQARAAEAQYRARHPSDTEIANRAGIVGDWRNYSEGADGITQIEACCGSFMRSHGMDISATDAATVPIGVAQSHYLKAMADLIRPPLLDGIKDINPLDDSSLSYVLAAMQSISPSALERSKISDADAFRLTQSMAEFARSHSDHLQKNLRSLGEKYRPGSTNQMSTLAALMRQRRKELPG